MPRLISSRRSLSLSSSSSTSFFLVVFSFCSDPGIFHVSWILCRTKGKHGAPTVTDSLVPHGLSRRRQSGPAHRGSCPGRPSLQARNSICKIRRCNNIHILFRRMSDSLRYSLVRIILTPRSGSLRHSIISRGPMQTLGEWISLRFRVCRRRPITGDMEDRCKRD